MENVTFKRKSFGESLKSMLRVDLRRMRLSRTFYIIIAIALLIPIVMTVMMTMMDGTESIDHMTGEVTVMEGPENAWQNIGTLPGGENMGGTEIFAMCNINMAFMGVAVFVCLFVSDDFKSGFAKNIFTTRGSKAEYVISKTAVGFITGSLMLIAYLIGSLLGGAIAGLSFDLHGLGAHNIMFCILGKLALMLVFVPIFTAISVAAKERTWLSILASLGGGMLLFMTVSLITPLGSGALNLLLSLAGGAIFSVGLGAVSNIILKKTRLV